MKRREFLKSTAVALGVLAVAPLALSNKPPKIRMMKVSEFGDIDPKTGLCCVHKQWKVALPPGTTTATVVAFATQCKRDEIFRVERGWQRRHILWHEDSARRELHISAIDIERFRS